MSFEILVADIETNGLYEEMDKIHCIATINVDTGEEILYTDIYKGLIALYNADKVVLHNGAGFDVPAIQKLYPRFTCDLIDTLCMSRLLFPERRFHSIKSYGKQFGTLKVEHEDWSVYTEGMGKRCLVDAKIGLKVYQFLIRKNNGWDIWEALELEQEISTLHLMQVTAGITIDIDHANSVVDVIDAELLGLDSTLASQIPSKYVKTHNVEIKKPFLKNGSYSKSVLSFFVFRLLCDAARISGPFSRVELKPLNLNSHTQIKNFLLSQGWKPDAWNYNKETKQKTSPKLTESSYASIKGGVGQLISRRNILRHRRNYLKNFKDSTKGMLGVIRSDGKIPADANTCGTNTFRYKHRGVYCNIPSNQAIFGKEIRGCFVASEGDVLVGCDLSGIEMRGAAHFAYPYDGGTLMDIVLNGDFHQEQADNVYRCSRSLGKSVTYAVLYGAGAEKIATMLVCSIREAQRIINLFWDFNEGLGKLKRDLEGALRRNHGYIINLDGRKTFIRAEYRILNTLLQSSCAIIFKRWLVITKGILQRREISSQMIAAYHDDCLHQCCPDTVPSLSIALQDAIEETRDYYNIVLPLEIDILVGTSLDQCH